MNSFVVSNCVYDGTSGDSNPICQVSGTVNSRNVYALTFFRYFDGRIHWRSNAGRIDCGDVQLLRGCVLLPDYASMAEPNPVPRVPGLQRGGYASRGSLSGCADHGYAGFDWIMDGVTANGRFTIVTGDGSGNLTTT